MEIKLVRYERIIGTVRLPSAKPGITAETLLIAISDRLIEAETLLGIESVGRTSVHYSGEASGMLIATMDGIRVDAGQILLRTHQGDASLVLPDRSLNGYGGIEEYTNGKTISDLLIEAFATDEQTNQ